MLLNKYTSVTSGFLQFTAVLPRKNYTSSILKNVTKMSASYLENILLSLSLIFYAIQLMSDFLAILLVINIIDGTGRLS